MDGSLTWPWVAGWLHTKISVRHRELNPDTVAHFSTNRARRRLTSLIEANALTTTPDHQPPCHHRSPGFYRGGSQKVQNWLQFTTSVTFDAVWSQYRATYRISNTSTSSDDDWASFWLRHIVNSSSIFTAGEKVRNFKFGLILVRGVQSRLSMAQDAPCAN